MRAPGVASKRGGTTSTTWKRVFFGAFRDPIRRRPSPLAIDFDSADPPPPPLLLCALSCYGFVSRLIGLCRRGEPGERVGDLKSAAERFLCIKDGDKTTKSKSRRRVIEFRARLSRLTSTRFRVRAFIGLTSVFSVFVKPFYWTASSNTHTQTHTAWDAGHLCEQQQLERIPFHRRTPPD